MKRYSIWALVLLAACNFKPDEIALPTWKSDWLGPLAKTELVPQEIQNIQTITFRSEFGMGSFNLPPGTYPSIPAINNLSIQQNVVTSDIYYEITFDSALTTISIGNNTPLTIKQGTVLSFEKNGQVLYSYTLPQNIAPNTNFTTPKLDFAGVKFYNEVEVHLKSLSTNAINSSTQIFGTERLRIEITIENLQLREVGIESNNHFDLVDTTDFQVGAGDSMITNLASGKLKLFFTNGFPIRQTVQAYVMDSTYQIVDSLLSNMLIIQPADVDANGYAINTKESSAEIILNDAKIQNLKKGRYLLGKARFDNINTQVPVVKMRKNDKFGIQVVGDIQLQYDLNANK